MKAKAKLQNSVLQTAEKEIESKLAPKVREAYMKIVVSGLKVALNGGENSPFAKMIRTTKDPIRDSANGAISLVMQMRAQTKGTMPLEAIPPAAMTLMLKALDLVDKSGVMPIGNEELASATKIFMPTMLKQFGITGQQLSSAAQKANALVRDPANLEKLRIAGGLQPAPGAKVVNQGGGNGV